VIRVVYDTQIFERQPFGGISNYFINIIKEFKANPQLGVEPIVLNHTWNEFLDSVNISSNTFIINKAKPSLYRAIAELNRLDARPFDLVHYSFYLPNRSLFNSNVKSITTIYDFIPEKYFRKFSLKRYMHYNKKSYLKRCSGSIFISNAVKNDSQTLYPKMMSNKTKVIHLGVSKIEKHYPSMRSNIKPFFLYVGSRKDYKNFDIIIPSFSKISSQNNIQLLCFGGGSFNKRELRLIKQYNLGSSIHHVGNDPKELNSLYGEAIALLNPSLEEGFGLTNLEAFSWGCPVICSDINVFREILGASAVYFNPKSEESLATAMKRVLQKEISEHQKTYLVEKSNMYPWYKTALETSEFYKEVLSQ